MKRTTIFLIIFATIIIAKTGRSQTTPPSEIYKSYISESVKHLYVCDTINFTPYATGMIINNQYQSEGVIFSGYNGSGDPEVYDYTGELGKILHSDDWYNPIRLNFVDTINGSSYFLAKKIEFDNPINTETDYISINVYDSLDNLIRHYLSESPEHIVLNFDMPVAAYMVLDDSSHTAYIVDNFLIDFGNTNNINEFNNESIKVYPNPSSGNINVIFPEKAKLEILNIEGKTIRTYYDFDSKITIDTEELRTGVYVLKITSSKGVLIRKFIKQ